MVNEEQPLRVVPISDETAREATVEIVLLASPTRLDNSSRVDQILPNATQRRCELTYLTSGWGFTAGMALAES